MFSKLLYDKLMFCIGKRLDLCIPYSRFSPELQVNKELLHDILYLCFLCRINHGTKYSKSSPFRRKEISSIKFMAFKFINNVLPP